MEGVVKEEYCLGARWEFFCFVFFFFGLECRAGNKWSDIASYLLHR